MSTTLLPSSSSLASATSTSSSPAVTTSPGGRNDGGGGPSSPLLFFVALGFGVVFTNLWIIVGVKYCFRYNQRNRARLAGDDPDAADLAAMPRQRRRREKKLMSMEEVNEKFPLTKYKTWRSARAQEGLPTAGGINPAASRPASVRNLQRVSEDEPKEIATTPASPTATKEKITSTEPGSPVVVQNSKAADESDKRPTTAITETTSVQKTTTNEEDDVADNDQIQTAIPTEQLPDPGDTCAICIDVLEDDDDIRGLTCGHAFHASCVDPWLTARRACCPLCKADYYTPKPRPEGETEEVRRRNPREEAPGSFAFIAGRGRGPPLAIFGRPFMSGNQAASARRDEANRRSREQGQANAGTFSPEVRQTEQPSWRSRINLPRLPAMSRIRNGQDTQPGQQPPSPSQLEAGNTTIVR